jgi:hypothetical protein
MTEKAISHCIRGLIKTDDIIFNQPEMVCPEQTAAQNQGQAWFYVNDHEGNRHRIIVEEA